MKQIVIIGDGIIGLSIAYELTQRGHSVTVVSQARDRVTASWAGAGMVPPANPETAIHPLEHLAGLSNQLHPQWSAQLRQQTGIDDQFMVGGSLHLARTAGEVASLFGAVDEWQEQKINGQLLDAKDESVQQRFRFLATEFWQSSPSPLLAWQPDAAQFHNPSRLRALRAALQSSGADWVACDQPIAFEAVSDGLRLEIDGQPIEADDVVIAAGPWSEQLVERLEGSLPMQPVRGQMVAYQLDPGCQPWVKTGLLINEGTRYLVPRQDGVVLAGSTIEEVGFDETQPVDSDVAEICDWATRLVPALNESSFLKSWAGLRPATYDGFPYLGAVPGRPNVWVAAGHFKGGLQLSTGTAVVIADLVEGRSTRFSLDPFAPSRVLV